MSTKNRTPSGPGLAIPAVTHNFLDPGNDLCSSSSNSNSSLFSNESVIHIPLKISKNSVPDPGSAVSKMPSCISTSRYPVNITDYLRVQPLNANYFKPGVVELVGKAFVPPDYEFTKGKWPAKILVRKDPVININKMNRPKTCPQIINESVESSRVINPSVEGSAVKFIHPLRLLDYQYNRSGVVIKIPASIGEEVLKLTEPTMDQRQFIYELPFDPDRVKHRGMNFEFYQNAESDYISIRVNSRLILPENRETDDMLVLSDLSSSSLTISILDEDGRSVGAEACIAPLKNENDGYKFEIEDFATRTEFQMLLTQYRSLNLLFSFTQLQTELTEEDSEININFIRESLQLRNETIEQRLQHMAQQNGFRAFLGSQMSNSNFRDGVVEIHYNAEVLCIPVHRVFLAAHSPSLKSLLTDSSRLIIEGFHPSTIMALLEYTYCGEVPTGDIDVLSELVELSELLQVVGLKEKCVQNAHENILWQHNNSCVSEMFFEYFDMGVRLQEPHFIKMAVAEFEKGQEGKQYMLAKESGEKLDEWKVDAEERIQKLSLLFSKAKTAERVESMASHHASILGSFEEATVGSVFLIPKPVCDLLRDETSKMNRHSATGDRPCIFHSSDDNNHIQLQILKDDIDCNQINLRVVAPDPDKELFDDDEFKLADCDKQKSSAVYPIFPIASAGLYGKNGRIVHECKSQCLNRTDSDLIWEFTPFFTTKDFLLTNLIGERGGITIRIALRTSYSGPPRSKINPSLPDSPLYSSQTGKLKLSVVENVMLNPFNHRLLAQLGNPLFSDAVLHVVRVNGGKWHTIPVYRIIISAFSPILAAQLGESTEIYLPEKNYSVECVEALLEYMYSGNIAKMSVVLGLKLLRSAKELLVHGLENFTIHAILCLPLESLESAILLYQYGVSTYNNSFSRVAINFFKTNKTNILALEDFQVFLNTNPAVVNEL